MIDFELCQQFYTQGWVSGTGGGISIRDGERVFMAPSGVQKERLREEDLFLLDMHLGDMSGFELAHRLQQEPDLAEVPRVAFSADAMPDQIHRARDRGFAGYLTKPLNVKALLACLDEHTERVRQRRG